MPARKPRTETVYDGFCGWPYHTPYGYVEVAIVKPKKPRKPRRRSAAAKALFTPIFKAKVIPNKKRATKRKKVTPEGNDG
jgi:hypothetical protein